jgi:hypothetical protein
LCFEFPLACNNFFHSGCSCNYSATKFITNSSIKSLVIRKHNQSNLIPFALGGVKFLHPLSDQNPLSLTCWENHQPIDDHSAAPIYI